MIKSGNIEYCLISMQITQQSYQSFESNCPDNLTSKRMAVELISSKNPSLPDLNCIQFSDHIIKPSESVRNLRVKIGQCLDFKEHVKTNLQELLFPYHYYEFQTN